MSAFSTPSTAPETPVVRNPIPRDLQAVFDACVEREAVMPLESADQWFNRVLGTPLPSLLNPFQARSVVIPILPLASFAARSSSTVVVPPSPQPPASSPIDLTEADDDDDSVVYGSESSEYEIPATPATAVEDHTGDVHIFKNSLHDTWNIDLKFMPYMGLNTRFSEGELSEDYDRIQAITANGAINFPSNLCGKPIANYCQWLHQVADAIAAREEVRSRYADLASEYVELDELYDRVNQGFNEANEELSQAWDEKNEWEERANLYEEKILRLKKKVKNLKRRRSE